jgi:biopolymer transport protein ExbB
MILLQIITGTGAVHDSVANAVSQIPTATSSVPLNVDSLSLFDLVVKGGWIMAPLVLLSLIAVYVFMDRLIAIIKVRRKDNSFMQKVKEYILEMKIDNAKTLCQATNSPDSKMIEKGLNSIGKPISEIEKNMESVGKTEISKLENNLKILGIIASIAPMLGFIGTILGVIKIFYNISLADNISIGLISSGLYEKMITSASGLMIGVLAYIGYHYLNILLDRIILRMESHAIEFIDILQKEA